MKILSHQEVAQLLPISEAIKVVHDAMIGVSAGQATLPLRTAIPVGGGNMMGVMPGAVSDPACFGVKLVSLFPGNPAQGLSSHRGAMVLFEAETGGAIAMMDASLLTAIRTAAASAVATDVLARKDATKLALIGTGEQAFHHLNAMQCMRDLDDVLVVGRSLEKAETFAETARARFPGLTIRSGTSVQAAVASADIVCTVTAAKTPILSGAWITPGSHLNIVGSSIPSMREVDDDVVFRSDIWVDYLPSTLAQAGEIVDLIKANLLNASDLKGEIGPVLDGSAKGRETPEQITLYRSLGVAAQDLAAAHYVYEAAIAAGIGQDVSF